MTRVLSKRSEWRAVWLLVMFDLPVQTKAQKRQYHKFRAFLIDEGFGMLQYSVYGRHLATREQGDAKDARVVARVPPLGQVRIIRLTEAQFSNMKIIQNLRATWPETAPSQLEFW